VLDPEPGSVLDPRTLNRTLLARQHLLERVDRPVEATVERLVGLQAQVPRDPYIALWSRVRRFDSASLERLLLERRVVRMTLMRTTLHLVTATDAVALRAAFQGVVERAFEGSPFRRRLDGIDVETVARAGIRAVEERPMTVAELGRALTERWPGRDGEALAYAVRYLVPLVQVTPRGLFRASSAARVTTLESWLAGTGDGRRTPAQGTGTAAASAVAIDVAVERYLRAFGPATAADIRTWSWLAGVREVIARLRPGLRTYRDERGRELLDVADGAFADPDETAPVRFLGQYDNVILSHADRSRITGELRWGAAWLQRGTFLVDGYLAGAWRLRESPGPPRLELEARRRLADADRADVEAEATALGRFLLPEGAPVDVIWIET
jgi:DNA glycosylase AlkZ-like